MQLSGDLLRSEFFFFFFSNKKRNANCTADLVFICFWKTEINIFHEGALAYDVKHVFKTKTLKKIIIFTME